MYFSHLLMNLVHNWLIRWSPYWLIFNNLEKNVIFTETWSVSEISTFANSKSSKEISRLSFCLVKASNLCLRLITLNLIRMYQFVAKSFDKTIISGVCFNQDVDIHVTTQEVQYSPLALWIYVLLGYWNHRIDL